MKNRILPTAIFAASMLMGHSQTTTWSRVVSASLPTAKITLKTQGIPGVTSADLPRTRQDWPVSVTTLVENLSTAADATVSQKAVNLYTKSSKYIAIPSPAPPGSFFPGPESTVREVLGFTSTPTGLTTATDVITSVILPPNTAGRQHYIAQTIAEDGGPGLSFASEILDEKWLESFPKPSCELKFRDAVTLEAGKAVSTLSDVPAIKVTVDKRYPGSVTFVQFYEGEPKSTVTLPTSTSDSGVIAATKFNAPISFPADKIDVAVTDMSVNLNKVGIWTTEFVSVTPVAPGSTFTTGGLTSSSTSLLGGTGKIVLLNKAQADWLGSGFAVGTACLVERGDVLGNNIRNTNVIINATITTNQ
jgi:hypothetical protein